MTEQPSISVVIALYNKRPFIAATLASALGQNLPALEIIVVDDGSTDGSAEWVEQLNDPRVRVIRQANGGVSRARNAGIAAASGNWVAFLDADDLWHPDYLLDSARLINQQLTVRVVACAYRSVSASDVQDRPAFDAPEGAATSKPASLVHDLPSRWLQGTCFFTSSIVVRRDTLAAIQPCFPPGEHVGEDLDLWFRLGEMGPIALSPAVLVLRLWVPGSLSSGRAAATDPPYILRMLARVKTGQTPALLRRPTLRYVGDSRVTLARDLISQGRRTQAWSLLLHAWPHASMHRWAMSLFLLLTPGPAVQRFQSWRACRKMIL